MAFLEGVKVFLLEGKFVLLIIFISWLWKVRIRIRRDIQVWDGVFQVFAYFLAFRYLLMCVVTARWMIHREEWGLNIFIHRQCAKLADTYKIHSAISCKQLTKELIKNGKGSKCCIAKRCKFSPNINQLDISLLNNGICRMLHQTVECGTRPFLKWVRAQGCSPDTLGIPKMP